MNSLGAIALCVCTSVFGAESVCTADLLCVLIKRIVPAGEQSQHIVLTLNNLSYKPLSFRLLPPEGLDEPTRQEVLQLNKPRKRVIATFIRPNRPWGFEYRVHYGHTRHTHCDDCVYVLPYAPDKSYVVSQSHTNLSTHRSGNRYALDWDMPVGEAVHAARGGRVVSTYAGSNTQSTTGAATANHIWIQHDDGTIGKYLHLAFQGILVEEGQRVQSGEHIGTSGNTGFTQGPHLHFSVSTLGGEALYKTFNVKFQSQFGVKTLEGGKRYIRTGTN